MLDSSDPMSPMISAPRIACEVAMKLRTSFVHSHRTPIEHLSIQRSNSALGLRRLRHLDKSDTAWLASIPVLDDRDGFDGSVFCKNFSQLLLCHRDIKVSDKNVGHEIILSVKETEAESSKAILTDIALSQGVAFSEWAYVLSLQAFGALRQVELHGLTLLKALETSRLDCREMHKNVSATLTANEAVALGVIEPLYCSLFCHVNTGVLSIDLRWRDSEVRKADY